ncbi:MAG: fimbrial biogenesis outer membrane usher protein [Burkholderiaceae bacterium]|nr:fimbrial biogenesis outer membrane usher protein [Burkholderiaceae bacterium]
MRLPCGRAFRDVLIGAIVSLEMLLPPVFASSPQADFDRSTTEAAPGTDAAQKLGAAGASLPEQGERTPDGRLAQVLAAVRLNGTPKGDFVTLMTGQGGFLLRLRDLLAMGLREPLRQSVQVNGDAYVALAEIPGAIVHWNEKTLVLDIQLPPGAFPEGKLDLGGALPTIPVHPREAGGFLNYQFESASVQGSATTYSGATELGWNLGPLLLLDDHSYSNATGQGRAVRLQTQLVYDQPDSSRRWTLGDASAASGDLGSSFNFGGVGVSKLYQMNPYFIKTPLAGLTGTVALPSTIDVYMNGARVQSQSVAPGPFSLQNLNTSAGTGLNELEFVIRDPFGREQHVSFPYFFSSQLLAKGLEEYSYNVGAMRNNYGLASNDYGSMALSAWHRYGWSDAVTLGLSGDATAGHANGGPNVSFNTVRAGVVTIELAGSRDNRSDRQSGAAASISDTYISGSLSAQLSLRRWTAGFSVIGPAPLYRPKLQGSAGLSYGKGNRGTYSLDYSVQTVFGGALDQRTATIGYNRTLAHNIAIFANFGHIWASTGGFTAFVGISYFPGNGFSVNVSHQNLPGGDYTDASQVAQTPPIGEGLGYRVLAQRSSAAGAVTESISPFVQYNARDAVFTVEGTRNTSSSPGQAGYFQASVAGAAALIDQGIYFGRPISDSYTLASIDPPVPGVRVLRSGAEVGVTDAHGNVFVPDLGSYQVNEIAVQTKDLPLDYSLHSPVQEIRPAYRSGVVARFGVRRVRAISGRLFLRTDKGTRALENVALALRGTGRTLQTVTVQGGDFYVEDAAPGLYSAHAQWEGGSCDLTITIAASHDIVTDLGGLACESSL